MGHVPYHSGRSWRGPDGEDDMSENDWLQRGLEQGLAMREGESSDRANPDDDGYPTAGYYNGDYTDEVHQQLNERLDEDEYYEAQTESDIRKLLRADTERRQREDP